MRAVRSTTVRIGPKGHRILKKLSSKSGETMPAILDRALEEFRRARFFEDVDAAYAVLQADPQACQEELDERALWEGAGPDDLEDD